MSRGTNLQEMEVKTQQSKTVVNANAKPADPMPTMADPGTQLGNVEDLGGPTPENSKPDDDSNKLKTPTGTLKQVKDVVNKGAKPADGATWSDGRLAEIALHEWLKMLRILDPLGEHMEHVVNVRSR